MTCFVSWIGYLNFPESKKSSLLQLILRWCTVTLTPPEEWTDQYFGTMSGMWNTQPVHQVVHLPRGRSPAPNTPDPHQPKTHNPMWAILPPHSLSIDYKQRTSYNTTFQNPTFQTCSSCLFFQGSSGRGQFVRKKIPCRF
eukprot:TRINITY_DN55039_c0_g1_i1.p2 TRINITY_DN55039_c0_g1~~TRINITY_DN55039_c0_g1_i1.p2  ORF type:complete len:140 (-),score=0.06 TRINITY_DN55039_c0_g1_i1:604-1023(-)